MRNHSANNVLKGFRIFILLGLSLFVAADVSAQTFTNPELITIPAVGNANPYPSQITVSGVPGTISTAPGSIKIKINRLTHQFPDDLDMVLVGPTGAALLIQSDTGGGRYVSNITYTISDSAGMSFLTSAKLIDAAVYKPGNFDTEVDNFPAPGPGTNYSNPGPGNGGAATFAWVFGGTNPNGVWKLVIRDDMGNGTGSIGAGWSISFGAGNNDLFAPSKLSVGAGDDRGGDLFGSSVAISDDTFVVGERQDPIIGNTSATESAYVYVRQANGLWAIEDELTGSDSAPSDAFGWSVAVSGDTIVAGAPFDDGVAGSAYVFVRGASGWTQEAKLTASDRSSGDEFGNSVSISGDTIVIGAYSDSIGANGQQGSAYVYTRSGSVWNERQKLIAQDGAAQDNFGASVAVSGGNIVVGAPNDEIGANHTQGSAYVFTNSGFGWGQQQKLVAGDGGQADHFGGSVDISLVAFSAGIIVGASGDDIGTDTDQGSAYIFHRASGSPSWTQEQKLFSRDGAATSGFGTSVVISGTNAVVGAHHSAYVFKRAGTVWSAGQKLQAFDNEQWHNFGTSLGLSGETVLVGAPGDTINGLTSVGSAYLFRLGGKPFDFDGDLKTDLAVFRPTSGEWWYLRSSDGGNRAFQFGQASDRIMPADYTGDGEYDVAFWRPSTGEWFVLRSEDSSFYSFPFGASGDTPSVGDFDGDGRADAAIFRSAAATWYISKSTGGTHIQAFGASGDVPAIGDYDGDQRADIAIFRPSSGEWWIQKSTGATVAYQFGAPSDKPVQGDYTGDGKTDVAVFRPSNGNWFVLRSENLSFYSAPFGNSSDIPLTGDYDGDGKSDLAIFRPSETNWYVNQSGGSFLIRQFGASGDRPVPNAFAP